MFFGKKKQKLKEDDKNFCRHFIKKKKKKCYSVHVFRFEIGQILKNFISTIKEKCFGVEEMVYC